jgi:SNF family Na+-dependent transporter
MNRTAKPSAEGPQALVDETPDHDGGDTGREGRAGRVETPLERLDRNLEEMTGELRVVVTGVQVLFAFLLVVPFNAGFAHVGAFERTVYFVSLLLAALSAVCTIAPSAQHRLLFRHDDKRHLVFSSNRIVIAGLAFLALAMSGSLLLVATKLFGETVGILTTAIGALVFTGLWFGVPLRRNVTRDDVASS